jgi:uncharacterized protein YjiS (DUF1127 family)
MIGRWIVRAPRRDALGDFDDHLLRDIIRPSLPSLELPQWNSWRAFAPRRVLPLWAKRRRQRRTLGELAGDQHLLDDVGLTRVQALREAAKPFWRR